MPGAIYEPDIATIHAGYVQTIAQAKGLALPEDAAIHAGNAFQFNGNSYAVEEVSLLILGDVPIVHIGQFDPHADEARATRPARRDEIEAFESSTRTQVPVIWVDAATLNAVAAFSERQSACVVCHADGSVPPLAFIYRFRELADD